MKKTLLIILLLFTISCNKENKYGVTNGVFGYPHFPQEQVEQTIIQALGCEICITKIEYPTGYPINTPRILYYKVIFEKEGQLQIKTFYIGKVLTEVEDKKEDYLRLIE